MFPVFFAKSWYSKFSFEASSFPGNGTDIDFSSPVWPDSAIFESSRWHDFYHKYPICIVIFRTKVKSNTFHLLTLCLFLGNFLKNLGYFLILHLVTPFVAVVAVFVRCPTLTHQVKWKQFSNFSHDHIYSGECFKWELKSWTLCLDGRWTKF